jgi:hypothetical protein
METHYLLCTNRCQYIASLAYPQRKPSWSGQRWMAPSYYYGINLYPCSSDLVFKRRRYPSHTDICRAIDTFSVLAEQILSMTGSSSRIIYKPLPADDPVQRQADTTRAETLLHWKPKVSLEEGLSKTIAYFRDLLDEEVC